MYKGNFLAYLWLKSIESPISKETCLKTVIRKIMEQDKLRLKKILKRLQQPH